MKNYTDNYAKTVATTLIVVTFLVFLGYVSYTRVFTKVDTRNSNEIAKDNPAVRVAYDLMESGNFPEAHQKFEELIPTVSDTKISQVLKLNSAQTLMAYDRIAGARKFIEFGNDATNSSFNRSFALLMAAQKGFPTNNIEVMRLFFSEDDFSRLSDLEKKKEVYQRIYDLYPMGTAAAQLARYELAMDSSTSTAERVYQKYVNVFENNELVFLQSKVLAYLAPDMLYERARLWAILSDKGAVSRAEASFAFERAFNSSKMYGYGDTTGYILLSYLNFLARDKDYETLETYLKVFENERLHPKIIEYLDSERSKKELDALYALSRKDKDVRARFLNHGW